MSFPVFECEYSRRGLFIKDMQKKWFLVLATCISKRRSGCFVAMQSGEKKCVAVIFFVVLQVDKKGLHDKKNKPT